MRLILIVTFLLTIHSIKAKTNLLRRFPLYFPEDTYRAPGAPTHIAQGKIVDGAAYSMHNTAFSLDLAMKANAPVDEEPLGKVTLEYFTNGKEHKWGTSFYGTIEVAVSNGMVEKNFVSVYYPEGSSRDKARLYDFETLTSPNLYRIKNMETKLCLVANQRNANEPIMVEFGSCTEGNYTWLLKRTG